MSNPNLTERQQKWFASVREGLERDTGRTLAEWIAIAHTCPEVRHRARLTWFREHHGLLQNRASIVISEAFGSKAGWSDPTALSDALWKSPLSKAILEAVARQAGELPCVIPTARKTYHAWSRRVQFAALRPARGGGAVLGLAVKPETHADLEPSRSEPWSERLLSRLPLAAEEEADERVKVLLRAAWEHA